MLRRAALSRLLEAYAKVICAAYKKTIKFNLCTRSSLIFILKLASHVFCLGKTFFFFLFSTFFFFF